MFYVKFTIKDYTTKEKREKESNKYDNINEPLNIISNYIAKQKNYIDIKHLGDNKTIVQKNGGEIVIELLED